MSGAFRLQGSFLDSMFMAFESKVNVKLLNSDCLASKANISYMFLFR